ncbi:MAG: class I SAM-dependent methyltransferase [Chloroflexales bacterium]|nr:class I SAM-dependent methyltransferase [Chloroflexales bacterium]
MPKCLHIEKPPLWDMRGQYQRLYAKFMERNAVHYEPLVAGRKRVLFAALHGNVLEIGPGAGPNMQYYPRDIHWIGVEPNPYMHPYLRWFADRRGLEAEIHQCTADKMELPAASVDAVVSTLVLCSAPQQRRTLNEIVRVLKPGGQFIFVEHVAAPRGTRMRLLQNLIQPVWTIVADGCCPNRETWATIEQAGFGRVQIEHFSLPFGPFGPHIAGIAYKAGAQS